MSKTPVDSGKSLHDMQTDMPVDVAQLIVFCNLNEYRVRLGDAFRDDRVHGKYGEKVGYSAAYSNHKLGLAIDLPLFTWNPGDGFQDGYWDYETSTTAYAELGAYWESLRPENVWGGHWMDGNHFSKWWQGRW